ncbi:MAG: peptidoglycan-binding protein [Planctomycetota bacterium]
MNLQKAEIQILDLDAQAVDGSKLPRKFSVQFNPTEYTLTKGAQIAEIAIPGLDTPLLQFVAGQNEKLSLDLFFDSTDKGGMGAGAISVEEETNKFYQLVKIQHKTHAPPRLRFLWGTGLNFECIVESITRKFTLFNPHGIPLRATLSVTFREYKTLERQVKELNLQSADHTKRHVVVQGETLSSIAAREYGDPRQWRTIADKNFAALSDLRRLPAGLELSLPATEVRSRRPEGSVP